MAATASHVSETTSLLAEHHLQADEDALSKREPDYDTTWTAESKLLARNSPPLFLTYLLQYSFPMTAVIIAGHLGTNELGAVSLASMTANVTGFAIYEGLATSLDTLCSQAYGAGKKELVGIHLQRMVYLMWLITIPIGATWICSPWILEALVPEKELAVLAGSYLQIYLIGAPGFATFEAGKRFLQAQGNYTASLVVLLVGAPFNVLLNFLFVKHFHWGFLGVPLAVAVSNTLMPILLTLYVCFITPTTLQCWPGFTMAGFRNWSPMVKLALPGVMMTFCEWLAFDILTFSASYLSTAHLAAQSVLMTVAIIMYHIPFPVSIVATTRFANLIGAGAIRAARVAAKSYVVCFIGIGLFDIILLVSLRNILPKAFTEDEEVRLKVSEALPVVAAAQFFDSLAALSNGMMRGLGRQAIGGWLNLAVYYIFAVPLALFLAFGSPQLNLAGFWIGLGSGLAAIALVEGAFIKWSNWQRAVDDARSREE